jgi:putative ABC transport system permease protein
VIGTTAAFFEQYRFRDQRVSFASGHAPGDSEREIAIGSEVAERLGYAVGDSVVLAHGVAAVSFAEHTAHPFIVSGVIAQDVHADRPRRSTPRSTGSPRCTRRKRPRGA